MHWTPRRAMVVLVLCNVLWAGSYVAGKEALAALSSVELNCLRFALAGAVLAPLLWRQRSTLRLQPGDLRRLAVLCLLGFVLNKAAEYTGLAITTASDTALLIASEGVFTTVMAWLLLRERMTRGALGGLAVGSLGVYLVIEQGLVWPHLGGGLRLVGDLLVLGGLVLEALYTVIGKTYVARLPGLLITTATIVGSLAVWIPAAAINVAARGWPHMGSGAIVGVVYLALASTVLAYLGWMVALRYVDAASAGITLFVQPLLGTVLAIVILGEHPSWSTLAGGLCIVGGVWWASRVPTPAAPPVALYTDASVVQEA